MAMEFNEYKSGAQFITPETIYGKRILAALFEDNFIALGMENGLTVKIYDGDQSCCEHRYMSTDDDTSFLIGKILTGIEIKEGPTIEAEHEEHEQAFLEIRTAEGSITYCTHNEHNGYYGGFGLTLEVIQDD